MANFGQMKTWVSKRLQDPDNTAVSSADVGDCINMALSLWKNNRFWFNEVTGTDTLTQGNATITLPSDWQLPSIDDAFVIEYSGIRYPLKKVSESQYNAMYLSNGIGQPWWYSKQANAGFNVYPIPDRNYMLRYFYLKEYAEFSADSDSNDFSQYAAPLLEYTAAAYASRDFRQDMNMYNAFWQQAQTEYQNLLVTTRKNNATGALTITSMLTSY